MLGPVGQYGPGQDVRIEVPTLAIGMLATEVATLAAGVLP